MLPALCTCGFFDDFTVDECPIWCDKYGGYLYLYAIEHSWSIFDIRFHWHLLPFPAKTLICTQQYFPICTRYFLYIDNSNASKALYVTFCITKLLNRNRTFHHVVCTYIWPTKTLAVIFKSCPRSYVSFVDLWMISCLYRSGWIAISAVENCLNLALWRIVCLYPSNFLMWF